MYHNALFFLFSFLSFFIIDLCLPTHQASSIGGTSRSPAPISPILSMGGRGEVWSRAQTAYMLVLVQAHYPCH